MQDIYTSSEINPVLSNVASQWMRMLERGKKFKEDTFSRYGREAMSYFQGPKSWDELMGREYIPAGEWPDVQFKMHINKLYEFVKIFGPSLYYNNPVRTVKPRAPVQIPGQYFEDPNLFMQLAQSEQARVAIDGIRAILLEAYLNRTPSRYGLDVESRQAIDEALIKGRGLLWTELVESPDGAFRGVTSRFESVDHLIVDPDAPRFDRAKWIARRCILPLWEVERNYGLRRGAIKGNMESLAVQADVAVDPDLLYRRSAGYTSDLLVYYEIWSKMGFGGRILGINPNLRTPLDEIFGDYCYLAVCNTCRFPLNMPPEMVDNDDRYEETIRAAQWPIPFWVDNKWPVSVLDFNVLPNQPWPMATALAARGELRFLNWIYSFLAGHIKNSSRDFVVTAKSLSLEAKEAILSGKDLTLIYLENDHGAVTDAINFLQHPEVNGSIWQYVEALHTALDKRLGLNEIMYGGSPDQTQPRSAAESNLRNAGTGIRPEDMQNQVESWQSEVAVKEAFCARYLLGGDDVALDLGPLAAFAWNKYVFTMDTAEAFHQLEYKIEAGSTLKPNKEFMVRQIEQAVTTLLPVFQNYAQTTGDLAPLNNLVTDYCKALDLDPNRYQLRAAPMPAMLPSSAPGTPTPQGDVQVPPASGQEQLG